MPKSNHVYFTFLDYTFRPTGGLSTVDLNTLSVSFDSVKSNPHCKQAIFAIEVINDKYGSLIGTRHAHIRFWFPEKRVEAYKVFKYTLAHATKEGKKYTPYRKHIRLAQESDCMRKLGYCMKHEHYKWLRHNTTSVFPNKCWFLYQDCEDKIKADVKKLIEVSKKNLLPIMIQHQEEYFPGSIERNPLQLIKHMIKSNKYNFQFMRMKNIIHIVYLGSQCTDAAIETEFSWFVDDFHTEHRATMAYKPALMTERTPNAPPCDTFPIFLTLEEKIGVTEGATDD